MNPRLKILTQDDVGATFACLDGTEVVLKGITMNALGCVLFSGNRAKSTEKLMYNSHGMCVNVMMCPDDEKEKYVLYSIRW